MTVLYTKYIDYIAAFGPLDAVFVRQYLSLNVLN